MVDPSGGTLTPIRDTSWSDRVRYQLRRGTTLIGRSAAADVCVNSTTVSRSHAQLDWTEQGHPAKCILPNGPLRSSRA